MSVVIKEYFNHKVKSFGTVDVTMPISVCDKIIVYWRSKNLNLADCSLRVHSALGGTLSQCPVLQSRPRAAASRLNFQSQSG